MLRVASTARPLGWAVGVLVALACETDFVARNDDFRAFVKDIAMQIAASSPAYVKREDISKETLAKEKDILGASIKKNVKEDAREKILTGKLEKFYEDNVLLDQNFIKDPKIKVKDHLHSLIAKIGENVVVRRFTRYQLGKE